MPPERNRPVRPMVGGAHRTQPVRPHIRPEYRPDHELVAPPRQELIRAHEPETIAAEKVPTEQAIAVENQSVEGADTAMDPTTEDPRNQSLKDIVEDEPKTKSRKNLWLTLAAIIIVIIVGSFIAAYSWYQSELAPASQDTTKHVRVTIASGTAPTAIAKLLYADGVIKSEFAFNLYTKLSHTENTLKAGTYSLQPSLSTPLIVDHLVTGKVDTFNVTFLPGDTLDSNRQKLIAAGYSASDVDAALKKTYNSPLFDTKPTTADLEGYLYGETNEFDTSASVSDILQQFFGEYNDFVTKNNIAAGFQKQGLTLYQGITLASIVQREMSSDSKDMPGVARVFLNRLSAGMTLGSDVTFQYAAKKLGVAPSPDLDSPYNTRKYPGLPPGPIATPGNSALLAVANPATNNYLFFLSGDDGTTYYATTDAQHQQNIIQHCQKKCSVD